MIKLVDLHHNLTFEHQLVQLIPRYGARVPLQEDALAAMQGETNMWNWLACALLYSQMTKSYDYFKEA